MAFNFSNSPEDIKKTIRFNTKQALPTLDTDSRQTLFSGITEAASMQFYLLEQKIKIATNMLFLQTARGEFLDNIGGFAGVERIQDQKAQGNLIFEGIVGETIPSGTNAVNINQLSYITTEDKLIEERNINIKTLTFAGNFIYGETYSEHNLATGLTCEISGADQSEYNTTTTILVLSATTFRYTVDTPPVVVATGILKIKANIAIVEAESDGNGNAYNLEGGSQLSIGSLIPDVNSVVFTDNNGFTQGADKEFDDPYRLRIADVIQKPIGFLNEVDLRRIVLSYSGNTRCWILSNTPKIGKAEVYFARDNDTDPIPNASAITAVQELIDSERMIIGVVVVRELVKATINFNFTSLTPADLTMQNSIKDRLTQFFKTEINPNEELNNQSWRAIIYTTIDTVTGKSKPLFTATINNPEANCVIDIDGNITPNASDILLTLGTVEFNL